MGCCYQSFPKTGGQFVFAEFHPVVWMFDDDFKGIGYNYFKSDAIVETNTGTYAEKDADMVLHTVSWNHGLSEVFTSLIDQKCKLQHSMSSITHLTTALDIQKNLNPRSLG